MVLTQGGLSKVGKRIQSLHVLVTFYLNFKIFFNESKNHLKYFHRKKISIGVFKYSRT
jgi:hypothetical protein